LAAISTTEDKAAGGARFCREAALLAIPALLALLVVGLAGGIGAGRLGLAAALAIAAALLLAWWRARRAAAIGRWLAAVLDGDEAGRLPDGGGAFGEVLRPMHDLARALARQRGAAADQRHLLGTLIDHLPDPVFLLDRSRHARRLNPAARRSFDVGDGAVPLGRLVRDPAMLAAIDGALDAGRASSVVFSPVADRAKRFAARIEPVRLEAGEQGALVSMREQSEQVMIERIRADFVANASHEIRTPLSAIHGFIETLRGPARDDPAARDAFLETMAEETQRMIRLVEDLLSLSRIELAANQPPSGKVDLTALLGSVAERLEPVARRRQVTLDLDLAPSLPAVAGDPDQLRQLLVNLIDNAIKYGAEGGPVRIEAVALAAAPATAGPVSGRASVAVAVVDHGPGIPHEQIPRLTERFYRVDTARSRRLGGTGLGLAIVKHIVRRHQAHLAIESELGRGSRFTVFLPV
jgi:two-component system phosphate regulon sensor histidine kinase PhoR